MTRHRLTGRREHDVLTFEHDKLTYVAGYSCFEDGGVAELFLTAGKAGTALETTARDAAILLSLLLQHGASVDEVSAALTREEDGAPAGPISKFLDIVGGADGGAQA